MFFESQQRFEKKGSKFDVNLKGKTKCDYIVRNCVLVFINDGNSAIVATFWLVPLRSY